jgi:hypothetical protein
VQEIQNLAEIDKAHLPTWLVYIALLFLALFVVGLFGALINNPIAILMTVGVAGLIILGFIWFANVANMPRPVIITTAYNGCLLCGSRWEWFPGNPAPEVKAEDRGLGARL